MTNGDKIPQAKHLENTAIGAKRYILAEIYELSQAVINDMPTNFTGATASVGGASGLVPAPAAGDENKFLQGNGSWSKPVTSGFFNIATTDWQNDADETSEFANVANISVSGLTADDYAEITFDRDCLAAVSDANVCASGETATGCIKIFAENVPESALSGQYVIFKGAN